MADDTTGQIVVFTVAGEEYALPIGCVHEIIRYTKPRDVASSDPSVEGVISLRGRILPVFDLSRRLGLAQAHSERSKILVVDTPGAMAGLLVDDVEEVLTVPADQFDDVPHTGGAGVDGIIKLGDRLVVLLDPREIVPSVAGQEDAGVDSLAA